MQFTLTHTDSSARAGVITTAHSTIETPIFMPVGTQASIKALDFNDMINLDSKIILANTYHLYLRQTSKVIHALGGLHKFSKFPFSFLTDSGGFQAFSLGGKKVHEGIKFKSHIDGSSHIFTPKLVLDTQYELNSDIMMVLDDLIGLPAEKSALLESVQNTTRWAKEALLYHEAKKKSALDIGKHFTNNLFAIIQGGDDVKLRVQSIDELLKVSLDSKNGFDGFAIGGLAVGESEEVMYDVLDASTPLLPQDKPRYLMGVGTPANIIEAIARGVDMFDCVMPTRNARNGSLFLESGRLNIKSSRYKFDEAPISLNCDCYTCQNFSRSYLHHLCKSGEFTFYRLASIHNLAYYLNLVRGARRAILENKFADFRANFYANLAI